MIDRHRKPHVHAALIKAWADGAEIEYKCDKTWKLATPPAWIPSVEYRIQPEPVVQYLYTDGLSLRFGEHGANLKLTFEDGKLIDAKVLK